MENYQNYIHQGTDWVKIAQSAWECRKLRLMYEKMEQEAFDQLKALSNNCDSIAGGFVFTKSERKGTVDYSIIPEIKSVNLEIYRKDPIQIWKLEKE